MNQKKLLLLLVLLCFNAYAQEPYAININRKDGLPTSNIYQAFQDKDGFIWFGTDMGVIKYDGFTFNHYSNDDGLSDNEIFSMSQDAEGKIWFATYNGKLSYFHKNKFYNETNDAELKNSKNGMIMKIVHDSTGATHILYHNGPLSIYKNGLQKGFPKNNGAADLFYQNTIPYYINSIGIFNLQHQIVNKFNISLQSRSPYRTLEHNNKFYFAFEDKIYIIENLKIRLFLQLQKNSNEIISLFIDSNSILWIGTRNGIYKKNILAENAPLTHEFPNNSVSSIMEDFEKNIWITTLNNGIHFLPNKNLLVYKDGKENMQVRCITKSEDNKLWCGGDGKYYIIDKKSIKKTTLKTERPENQIAQIYISEKRTIILGGSIMRIIENKKIRDCEFVNTKSVIDNGDEILIGYQVLLKFSSKDFEKLQNMKISYKNPMVKYKDPVFLHT